MSFSQSLLPEFDQEMQNTRKILECVPDNQLSFTPHPKSMSIARVATHVAELPGWTNVTLDQEVLEMDSSYKPVVAGSSAELLQIFDKAVAEARPKIEAATDADWAKIWTFKWNGETVLSMPRAAVMRTVIMNHLIHHRAQLGVFLRLVDVAIPGMYGPSADEKPFTAAQK
jgi:uncharacterized damage-inducible protein DinB